MKITIELSDRDVEVLKKWASVSRTLNNASYCCDELLDLTEDGRLVDRAHLCIEELEEIGPVLDRLHYIVRDQIWLQPLNG
jgi:hypothetical protein